MDVVDDEHERLLAGDRGKEAPDGPCELLGRCRSLVDREQPCRLRRDRLAMRSIGEEHVKLLPDCACRLLFTDPRKAAHDLGDGPVRDPFAVGKAAAARRASTWRDVSEELAGKSRLAGARLSDDGHEPARALGTDRFERGHERLELRAATDERRNRTPRRLAGGGHPEQPEGGQRLGLSLHPDRLQRLHRHRSADKPRRRLAEQHLTRLCRLLKTRRDVDRVAEHHRIAADEPLTLGGTRDHLTRVHTHPHGDAHAVPLLEFDIQVGDPLLDLERGPASPERVVLVHHRNPEHSDDCVTDELLHRAPVPLEGDPDGVEVRAHQVEHDLRVNALTHRRRPRQIAEDRRDKLTALDSPDTERDAARTAEPLAVGILRTARTAPRHGDSLPDEPPERRPQATAPRQVSWPDFALLR